MRIISGERRGHKIAGPTDRHTRATSDRVRESIFNILGSLVEDALILDLCAGTGALGLEALSHGGLRAIFVERNRENADLIRSNLATLRYEDRGVVLVGDVYTWADRIELPNDVPAIVFFDPPYDHYTRAWKKICRVLTMLQERVAVGSSVVLEMSKLSNERVLPNREAWDLRRYGDTQIAFWLKTEEFSPLEVPSAEPDQPQIQTQTQHENEIGESDGVEHAQGE